MGIRGASTTKMSDLVASPVATKAAVSARLSGSLREKIEQLLQFARPTASCVPAEMVGALRSLQGLLADTDNSIQAGLWGGHAILTKLMMHHDEEVAEAASDCISDCTSCLPSGLGFPIAPCSSDVYDPPGPIRFNFGTYTSVAAVDADLFTDTQLHWQLTSYGEHGVSLIPDASTDDAPSTNTPGRVASTDVGLADAVADIWTRAIPAWINRMRSQDDVGQLLWPAALPFSRWLVAHRGIFASRGQQKQQQQRVLEIGSGMGLCGIVAAMLRAKLVQGGADSDDAAQKQPPLSPLYLSDFNPLVLHNLEYNARLNEPVLNQAPDCAARTSQQVNSRADSPAADAAADTPNQAAVMQNTGCNDGQRLMKTARLDWTLLPGPAEVAVAREAYRTSCKARAADARLCALASDPSSTVAEPEAAASGAESQLHADIGVRGVADLPIPSWVRTRRQPQSSPQSPCAAGSSCEGSASNSFTATPVDAASTPTLLSSLAALESSPEFDLIIGSDMICSRDDAYGVASCIAAYLADDGVAILMLAPCDVRWGVEHLGPACAAAGLKLVSRTVNPCFVPSSPSEAPESAHTQAAAPYAEALHGETRRREIALPAGLSEVVVAGGYEARLQLHVITWAA